MLHCVLNGLFGPGVYAGSSFIQNKYFRIAHKSAGNAEQLALALADIFARAGKEGVKALGQLLNQLGTATVFYSFLKLRFCSVLVAVFQIMTDSI